MKVLLVTAPWSFAELYPERMSGKMTISGATPPLGILYLSACLKRAGHTTAFIDGMDRATDDVLAEIEGHAADVVGFSCSTFAWQRTVELARRLKARTPQVTTLVGGPHVTGALADSLEDGVDFGLAGDAEDSIVALVDALAAGRDPGEIPGLLRRDAAGRPHYVPRRIEKDLDRLPLPDYDLVDLEAYPPSVAFYNRLPSMTMLTSRGCPAVCTFCDAAGNFRVRSIDNVMAEIEHLVARFGVRHLLFYDEDMAVARARLHALCERLIAADLDIAWCCNARADSLDDETVALMARAGCWRVLLGIESGSQAMLDTIMKGMTLALIKRQVTMIRGHGVEVLGTFMLGLPGETLAMGRQTIDFAIEAGLDYAIFLKYVPFPGTPLADEIERHGRVTGRWAPNLISFVPDTMTEAELAGLSAEAIRRFYMRPAYLLKRGLKMRSWRDLERNLRGFFSFFGLRDAEYMSRPVDPPEVARAAAATTGGAPR